VASREFAQGGLRRVLAQGMIQDVAVERVVECQGAVCHRSLLNIFMMRRTTFPRGCGADGLAMVALFFYKHAAQYSHGAGFTGSPPHLRRVGNRK